LPDTPFMVVFQEYLPVFTRQAELVNGDIRNYLWRKKFKFDYLTLQPTI